MTSLFNSTSIPWETPAPSYSLPSPDPAANIIHPRPLDLVITRIRRRLVQNIRRCPPQLHPLALEPHIRHPRLVLVPVTEIILEEQRQALDAPEEAPLDGDLLDLPRARELEFLRGVRVFGRGKVQVVAVDEEF